MDIKQFKTIFDIELNSSIQHNLSLAKDLNLSDQIMNFLNYLFDFIGGGGKRIRPYLCYLGYLGFGGKDLPDIIKIGVGLEFWHGFALVHDDIMDQADKRRGIDTVHKFIQKNTVLNSEHIGLSQAILIGDMLFSWANKLIFENKNFQNQQFFHLFNQMTQETIYGQMIDVELTISDDSDFSQISQKNFLKTSNYTFIRPMQIGAILAGADSKSLDDLKIFGTYLGQAFQVRDDLKDIIEDSQNSSKSRFNDISEGAKTIFTDYIFKNGTPDQKSILKNSLGKKLGPKEISYLQDMFETSGAITYGHNIISQNLAESQKILEKIVFEDDSVRQYFDSIINMISKT